MIGRLNHVAIAVRDIAKAAEVYRRTLGATVSASVPQPGARRHDRVRRRCPTPRSSCWNRSATNRRSRNSWSAIRTAACITSATRSTTSWPPATA